jgi:hypothetical protein
VRLYLLNRCHWWGIIYLTGIKDIPQKSSLKRFF